MRMIDADALLRKICGDSCGCEPDQCGYLDEYRHERCKAGQYVENAPTVNGWISVKDRLPELGKDVLLNFTTNMAVCCLNSYGWIIASGGNWYTNVIEGVDEIPQFWMPLPERPKEGD